jgi:hypothetical protein
MTTTDTPRTDAEIWNVVYHHKNEIVVDANFARELERELKSANDEIEFFKKIGQGKVDELRASKAEVERLKKALESL